MKKYGVNVLRSHVVETHGLQLVGLDYMNANADEDTFELHPSDDSRTIKAVLASLHLKDVGRRMLNLAASRLLPPFTMHIVQAL